jgi:NADPH:quinone reductase-like Zn-dependent oxidoreductase
MKGVFFSHRLPNLCELRTFPIPKPDRQEILVKNVCVASNPKDFKYPEWNRDWHSIEGNDIAGVVESVGEGVTEFRKGDRVAAYTKMHTDIKFGAYAGTQN